VTHFRGLLRDQSKTGARSRMENEKQTVWVFADTVLGAVPALAQLPSGDGVRSLNASTKGGNGSISGIPGLKSNDVRKEMHP